MSDAVSAAGAQAPAQAITVAEARERYAAAKAGQPEAAGDAQQVPDDLRQTRDETEDDASSAMTEAVAEIEPEVPQTIDLGDGLKVSLDEVRDGFMLKADHTRKTQRLAEERRRYEAERSQRLGELDHLLGALKQHIPRPRSLKAWLAEDPAHGLAKFAEQTERLELLANGMRAADGQRARAVMEAEAARDRDLAENYNTEWSDRGRRDRDYAALSSYALKEGAHPQELRGLLKPWMIRVVDKAAKYDALQASKGKVARIIADKPKVVRPGTKVSSQAAGQAAIHNAHTKLKSSGNLADAVALLRTMRKGRAG